MHIKLSVALRHDGMLDIIVVDSGSDSIIHPAPRAIVDAITIPDALEIVRNILAGVERSYGKYVEDKAKP